MAVPKLANFIDELSEVSNWYTFCVFLRVPTVELETISRNYGSEGVMRCLIEAYKILDSLDKLPSWTHIVDFLTKMKNISLAKKIDSRYVKAAEQTSTTSEQSISNAKLKRRSNSTPPLTSSSPIHSPQDRSCSPAKKNFEVPKKLAKDFTKMDEKFTSLTLEVKRSLERKIQEKKVSLQDVQFFLEEHYKIEPLEGDDISVNQIFSRLRQHYCVLQYRILTFLAETFLKDDEELEQLVNKYELTVKKFKNSVTLKNLMNLIVKKRNLPDKHKIVRLKVREFWEDITLEKFENMVNKVLQTLYAYTSKIRVATGCISLSWVIPNIDTTNLIAPLSLEFVKIIGVVSLHVGENVIYDIPGEAGCEVLEAAMLQAVELKNTEAVELLLSVGCDPEAITFNGENSVTNIVNIRESYETAGKVEQVCIFGHHRGIDACTTDLDDHPFSKKVYFNILHENDLLKQKMKQKEAENESTLQELELLRQSLEQKNAEMNQSTLLTARLKVQESEITRLQKENARLRGLDEHHKDIVTSNKHEVYRYGVEDSKSTAGSPLVQKQLFHDHSFADHVHGDSKTLLGDENHPASHPDGYRVHNIEPTVDPECMYEPPTSMHFVGEVAKACLTSRDPIIVASDHDIKVQINGEYWDHNPSEGLQCCLTASLCWTHPFPSGYVFVSPVCFFSCKAKRPFMANFTVPHALADASNDLIQRVGVFVYPCSNLSSENVYLIKSPDFTMDSGYVSFTATLAEPSLFLMGVRVSAVDISSISLSLPPLRCSLFVVCPIDRDEYSLGTNVDVHLAMSLKSVETTLQSDALKIGKRILIKKEFVLAVSEVTVSCQLEDPLSDWLLLKGKGLLPYSEIPLSATYSQDPAVKKLDESHNCYSYAPKVTFPVLCCSPEQALRVRVSVVCDSDTLVDMLTEPYSSSEANPQSKSIVNVFVLNFIEKTLNSHLTEMAGAVEPFLQNFNMTMALEGLIPQALPEKSGSFSNIMNSFKANLVHITDLEDLKISLVKFLSTLRKLGDKGNEVSEALRDELEGVLAMQVMCKCGHKAIKLQTKKKNENEGRYFFKCNNQCKFFKWKDETYQGIGIEEHGSLCSSGEKSKLEVEEVTRCYCGEPIVRLMAKTEENFGRMFITCPKPQSKQCKFFQWVDSSRLGSKERARTTYMAWHDNEDSPKLKKGSQHTF